MNETEGQDVVIARIDERTKNTDQKLSALISRLDTHYVTKDTLEVFERGIKAAADGISAVKSDCTRECDRLGGEVRDLKKNLGDYATCERVSELEEGLFDSDDAGKIRELIGSDDMEKRAATRGDVDPLKRIVYGFVGLILIAFAGALIALIIHVKS